MAGACNSSIETERQLIHLTRRGFIVGAAACVAADAGAAPHSDQGDQGDRLYADVLRYERFGHHRTASRGDVLTSRWLAERLRRMGFAVELQPFAHELFEPEKGELTVEDVSIPTFPLWPVKETAAEGVGGRLVRNRLAGPGEIALVRLPYAPNASLGFPGYAELINDAVSAGPAAVIGVTEGPTGEVIALNVPADAEAWPMPVALIGSRRAESLMSDRSDSVSANLRQRGRRRAAVAHNVIARRPGRGPMVVVSTPTSGWFTCAGERGSGIALFLAMARHCSARFDRPLLFLATSGHEFEGLGSRVALAAAGPDPASVGAWIHIGANVAGADIDLTQNPIGRIDRPFGRRGVGATAPLFASTRRIFQGIEGYSPAVPLSEINAVGDVSHYLRAGYTSLLGLVGAHPLHHTTLDVADLATTPNLLHQALQPLIQTVEDMFG